MNATRYEDLMQRVLDGEVTPEEEAQLQAALAADAGLRGRYQELQRLFGVLEAVGEMEPPAGALEEVLRQVHQHSIASSHASGGRGQRHGLRSVLEALRRRVSPQLAYAFGTGALAGVALLMAFQGRPGPPLLAPGTLIRTLQAARNLDTAELQAAGFRAEVRLGEYAGSFFLEIETDFERAGTIELEWEGTTSAVVGFERSGADADLAIGPAAVRIDATGACRYRLWLAAAPEALVHVRLQAVDVSREATLRTQADS